MAKYAINGFGRIGRNVLRAMSKEERNKVVAINDLTPIETIAHLLKYDSTQGKFDGEISIEGDYLVVDGHKILITVERDPANLPWKDLGVDVVLESTGLFPKRDAAKKHLDAGAKKVLISAPSPDPDLTFVLGINDSEYDPAKHDIVSNASCTTNCLAPMVKVLDDKFGVEKGMMSTIHSYTNDQRILDLPHKDPRRARAAAINIIPTTTGAAKAVGKVIPSLNGKLTGMSMRVPTLDVSVVDLTVKLAKPATYEDICKAMKDASEGELKGVLGYTEAPVVSSDFISDPRTSIFDAKAGIALTDTFVKVVAWYDNECGYATKAVELMRYMDSVDNNL